MNELRLKGLMDSQLEIRKNPHTVLGEMETMKRGENREK